ncbi:MAG TPA: N-acetylmuramoyl-L-alanine amidase [Thermoanaerobaculia bacterium]|nr:N-acetylmuramoyl-L-alanine amidase [Thermoanaerobaculia bacterium]
MPASKKRSPTLLLLAVVCGCLAAAPAAPAASRWVAAGEGLRAAVEESGEILVESQPRRGEGLLAFARRLTGSTEAVASIRAANGGREALLTGRWYRVPYRALTDETQIGVVRAVFGSDCLGPHGWVHHVEGPMAATSLWRVAEWFTGSGENFARLRAFNAMEDEGLRPGDRLVVPAELLPAAFRRGRADCPEAAATGELDYERDGEGGYGVYRLKRGEALYSSVVVRFTGLTTAADVNALAAEIATLNRIPDVTDIAAGRPIRIPFEHLLPEYLPADHPRRLAYERDLSASEGYENTVLARDLSGITVVLDAGHGGEDPGNTSGGLWESIYVYDVMLRTKELLERTTGATVVPTTRDGEAFRLPERDVLPPSRNHAVLTSPPYRILDAVTGVHLRWYLANSALARAMAAQGDPRKVVFLSIHAESLHPSLRGAMAYIPAASLTGGRFGKSDPVFASRSEVRERPMVEFSLEQRRQSEGLSRELGERILDAFVDQGLAVHTNKPLRDKIVRHRKPPFVPAVLRYNAVPAKVLVEICNLNNPQDRSLIQTRRFRQQVAEALVAALVEYYGDAAAPPVPVVAAAAR